MLIPHKGHTDTIQVYSVTVMTHVKALQAGHSSQGTSAPITPGPSTAKSLCASAVAFRPGSHVSESELTPSVIVSAWNDLSTPSTNSHPGTC